MPIVNCDFEIIDSEDSDIEMPATIQRSRVKFEQEVCQAQDERTMLLHRLAELGGDASIIITLGS